LLQKIGNASLAQKIWGNMKESWINLRLGLFSQLNNLGINKNMAVLVQVFKR
jgi:hypothetical protein